MNLNFPLLRPAPHIPRLPRKQAQQFYPKMRWQIMESTFIGYATFYFVRNNLPVVSREMGLALHYSKEQAGNILAATAIAYGAGKLFMGAWSDRGNPRYSMPLGVLCAGYPGRPVCDISTDTAKRHPTVGGSSAHRGVAQRLSQRRP